MALVLAAVLVSTWFGEYAYVRRTFGKGGPNPAGPGIHDVTSPDMPGFRMMISGSVIDLEFAPGALETPIAAVHHWIAASACAVTTYYGRFPVKHLHLLILPVEGPGRRSERKNHGLQWRLYKGLLGPTRDRRRPQARLGYDP
jgi:hypothetical protein